MAVGYRVQSAQDACEDLCKVQMRFVEDALGIVQTVLGSVRPLTDWAATTHTITYTERCFLIKEENFVQTLKVGGTRRTLSSSLSRW